MSLGIVISKIIKFPKTFQFHKLEVLYEIVEICTKSNIYLQCNIYFE